MGYLINNMQTVAETRRQRLALLVKSHGGRLSELNEAIGLDRTDATLSQIRTQAKHSKTGKPRAMGDDLARKIEERLQLQTGWMDTPPSYAEIHGEESPQAKVMALMERLPESEWPTAIRLLDALAKPTNPKNGTSG